MPDFHETFIALHHLSFYIPTMLGGCDAQQKCKADKIGIRSILIAILGAITTLVQLIGYFIYRGQAKRRAVVHAKQLGTHNQSLPWRRPSRSKGSRERPGVTLSTTTTLITSFEHNRSERSRVTSTQESVSLSPSPPRPGSAVAFHAV
ncbi:hypothetical protein PQX77_017194 [Marasmius sp. AFHP31]|nr:hypothetical protein PQX77_017194 [Marasmius sp. AFHP31]